MFALTIPDSTLTILLTALPPTLVALAAFVVGIMNSYKADKIHVLVNSNLHQVQSDLAIANQRIEALAASLSTAGVESPAATPVVVRAPSQAVQDATPKNAAPVDVVPQELDK